MDEFPLGPTRLGFAEEKDVDAFVARLEAFERGDITPDEWRAFRLVNGVYGQRQDGAMMIRVKIPGGILTPPQLYALADVAERWAGGQKGHVTTRQNVQLHFVAMEHVEEALRLLADAGLTTREACGNSVRNWTLCPFAGASPDEPFDATPYLEALARHLLRGKYSSTLPRKFKPAVSGCCGGDCALARVNDLGFLMKRQGDVNGFEVTAGGGLSTLRRSALTLEEFLPADEILEAAEAVVRVFDRIGNRQNKAKARLKWAIDKVGPDAFRAEYRRERETIRAEGGRPLVLPEQPRPPLPSLAQPVDPAPGFEAWLDNVRPQKQRGFSAVTIRLPLGDATAAQFRALATLCAQGEGELRATPDQNLVVRWVPTWRLPLFHRELAAAGLARPGAGEVADVVACPGTSSCKLAVTASRGLAGLLTEYLEAHPALVAKARDLHIKISGCPNGCGQHYIAGVGFQGGVRKIDGRAVPQYLVYLGGGVAPDRAFFGRLVGKVPARYVPQALERLVDVYAARQAVDERPEAFFARLPLDEAKALLKDLMELDAARAVANDFIDIGETAAFVEEVSDGECAA